MLTSQNQNVLSASSILGSISPFWVGASFVRLLLTYPRDEQNDDDDDDDDLEVAHPQSGSSSTRFLIELEFGNVGF